MTSEPIAFSGIPVRLDATLCDPHDIWVEYSDGTVQRVYPPSPPDERDGESETL